MATGRRNASKSEAGNPGTNAGKNPTLAQDLPPNFDFTTIRKAVNAQPAKPDTHSATASRDGGQTEGGNK
jgi:hypothetical protein